MQRKFWLGLVFGLIGTASPGAGLDLGASNNVRIPAQKSSTGQRFVCIDTNGQLVSSTTACVGT
jgi:hypothetical protein